MLVAFPGINAPIPEGADPRKWAARPVADVEHVSRGRWEPHRGAAFSHGGQSMSGTEVGGIGAGAWERYNVSHQDGQLAGHGGQLAGHDRQLAGEGGEWRPAEGNASGGRKKSSRWDSHEAADYSRSWPGTPTFLGNAAQQTHSTVEEPRGWSQTSGYAAGGWNGSAVGVGSVQNGGVEDGGEFGDEPLPPGYEHAQPWQADSTYSYQNQTGEKKGATLRSLCEFHVYVRRGGHAAFADSDKCPAYIGQSQTNSG
jgi:hypothetical protein